MATTIMQLESGKPWRDTFRRATFRSVPFYVDMSVRDSARRIVWHEFPKRDVPYAEDMGRKARGITVRGHIIVFVNDTQFPADPLKRRNYIPARDKLIEALETEGPALLQLPFLGVLNAACASYHVTEEDKLGGFCTFDMTFQEYGQPPATGTRESAPGVYYLADNLNSVTQAAITAGIKSASGIAI